MLGTENLYTAAQTLALDQCAIYEHSIPGTVLMARAAAVALAYLLEAWPEPERLQVICGTGNNGGDGFLIADLAHKRGIKVTVFQLGDRRKISGDAALAMHQAQANGVEIVSFEVGLLLPEGVIVDAMLGTGLGGEVRGVYVDAIAAINACAAPVLAVDMPSGLCADTGTVLGSAVVADLTVSFIGLKRGLFTLQGPECSGAVQFSDLAIPPEVYAAVPAPCVRLALGRLLECLSPRPVSAHKGLFGNVLVIGGDYGFAGAAAMAAESALRCGAGLVQVATRPEHVAAVLTRTPEVMPRGVAAGDEFVAMVEAADVLVAGPGLGQSSWSLDLLRLSVGSGKPLVLDADALNLLAAGVLDTMGLAGNWVLTPHPGEAARLLGCSTGQVQADRFAAVNAVQQRYGGVVILKGNGTLVTDGQDMLLSDYGNPGMASGGMGDVLSGVIGALLAQHLPPLKAAALGVCLHGAAADIAAQEGQRGLVATDLIPEMRSMLG
ncbi:MAG: NAD(P)H-hydrate dehydratase [Halioglobus sp.]|nr:NAD(P)H-hydrate dehydratase [Halioglobus sp.]